MKTKPDQTTELARALRARFRPTLTASRRCKLFRMGQRDRKASRPCSSANGAYLDGWYAPDQQTPPYVSAAQAQAFNL